MVVFAPMPSARVRIATRVKAGAWRSVRKAYRISWLSDCSMRLLASYADAMCAMECPISRLAKYKHISALEGSRGFRRVQRARFRDNHVRECDGVVESRAFFVASMGNYDSQASGYRD